MGPSVLNRDSSIWCFMEYIPSKIVKQISCCAQVCIKEVSYVASCKSLTVNAARSSNREWLRRESYRRPIYCVGRLEARQSYVLIESDGHSGERERHSGEHDAKRARVERPSKRLLSESVRLEGELFSKTNNGRNWTLYPKISIMI